MSMILLAAGCYVICSLSDQYAVAKAKLDDNAFTWIMACATLCFLTLFLPFIDHSCPFSWQAIAAILLITLSKLLEFKMSALVLTALSAFELKAWLGLNLFVSYFTDVFAYGKPFGWLSLLWIAVTGLGLFLIAKSNRESIPYRKILLPLIVYLAAKFSYGYIIKIFETFTTTHPERAMSSTMVLYWAFILLTIGLLPFVPFRTLWAEKRKGVYITAITKLPNAIGLIAENLAISLAGLTGYALIQPIILTTLFFIGVFRKERHSRLNLFGGLLSVIGILCFSLLG